MSCGLDGINNEDGVSSDLTEMLSGATFFVSWSETQSLSLSIGSLFKNTVLATEVGSVLRDKWSHILITYDGTGMAEGNANSAFKIFVDSSPSNLTQNSTSGGWEDKVEIEYFKIGGTPYEGTSEFSGLLDEFAIWDSDESSKSSLIYNSGELHNLSTLLPAHFWMMGDNDTLPIIADDIGGLDLLAMDDTLVSPHDEQLDSQVLDDYSGIYALSFDGDGDYLKAPEGADLSNFALNHGAVAAAENDSWSVSFWVKPVGSGVKTIISAGQDGLDDQDPALEDYGELFTEATFLLSYAEDKSVFLRVGHLFKNTTIATEPGSVPLDTWSHILVTYNGIGMEETNSLNNIHIFVNSNDSTLIENSVSGGWVGSVDIEYFKIGGNPFVGTREFGGELDELAIWSSDQTEKVESIYNLGQRQNLSALSPDHFWILGDNDTLPKITDKTGSLDLEATSDISVTPVLSETIEDQ
jgi:hypothetical protein